MNNSILAWIDERAQLNAKANKLKIVKLLLKHEQLSSRQMSEILFKEHESIRKRCSDLVYDDIIVQTGNRIENGYQNAVYSLNQNYNPKPLVKKAEKYTVEEILKAAEMGEVSMIDAKHIVSYLDEARGVIRVELHQNN